MTHAPLQILRSRVLLRPRDFGVSLAFYERQLGLHRSREFGRAPHRGVVFFLGGGELELTEAGGEGTAPAGVRLWLQVPDVEAAVTRLEAEGVDIANDARQQPWGLIEASVLDPDGLELVLVEVPEGHPLRRDTRS